MVMMAPAAVPAAATTGASGSFMHAHDDTAWVGLLLWCSGVHAGDSCACACCSPTRTRATRFVCYCGTASSVNDEGDDGDDKGDDGDEKGDDGDHKGDDRGK